MKFSIFAGRNFKEITRDPTSILMGIGFPVLLIVALSLMKKSIGGMADIFEVQNFAPSMTIFGLAFLGMFVGTLMSTDRDSSFLSRLFASPLKSIDYILGYSIPVIPLAVLQAICCFAVAMIFGLELNKNVLVAIITLLPVAVLFIAFGLFMGSMFTSNNSVNGFGTILVNAAVFLSGAVLPLDSIGGTFQKVCNLLPFSHAVDAVRCAISGSYSDILLHLVWILGYAIVLVIPAVIVFKRKMKG
ncbi:ABC transporter permease [Emergencia sp. 1XD21-10]|uniref:ABC transporter permease n=1 Tax=Emergencia sp. 1XD21-10 TaxID=2304569 RepID=UPI00137A0E81|nr:ABC transporter permease [Emergencia sp. 1XD21-10]MCR0457831.1 ABC transporter permease [[Clostridium] innocuum]NCE98279.1 ABC transporter permease [Emergencia sp. 1XD21-10]